MTTGGPDPLKDARVLEARVRALQALLELQRWQIDVLSKKLYSSEPGGIAARRLLDLKRLEAQTRHITPPVGMNDP